jgi:hypothetical protein
MPHDLLITTADLDTQEIVRETLADVTPRAAALALLRFADYIDLIQSAGVEATDELCSALFEELRAVCQRDS